MLCPVCGLDNDPSAVLCARCNSSLALGNPPPADHPAAHPSMHPAMRPADRQPTMLQSPVPASPAPVPWRLIIVAAALVVLVGVAGSVVIIVLTGKPKTTPVADRGTIALPTAADSGAGPTEKAADARAQATWINALLDRSVASRTKLNKAIDKVNHCTDLAPAVAAMRKVGVERTQQIAEAEVGEVAGLPDGEKIRSDLKAALGFALAADQHFLAWAQPTIGGGCADTAARRSAWQSAQASSQQAQAAKQKLLDVWNPVAPQFGFPTRTTQSI